MITISNRFWLVCWSGSLLLLLATCGASSGGLASANNTGSDTPTRGSVSVLTDRFVYQPADRIQATVRNRLSTPIYALNGRAECSILSLEVQIHGRWQASSVAGCLLAAAVRRVRIDPGTVYRVSIHAGSPGVNNLPMPAGTYRLVLRYWTNATGPSIVPRMTTTIYSATFSVR